MKDIKEQEASGLLSTLGINPPLSKIPVVGLLLPEMYLRQSGFTQSACDYWQGTKKAKRTR